MLFVTYFNIVYYNVIKAGLVVSFPIGFVKTESGFIVRSVETALGR